MELKWILLVVEILSLTKATVSTREYYLSFPFQSESFDGDMSEITIYNPNSVPVNIKIQRPFIRDFLFVIGPGGNRSFDALGDNYQMDKKTGYYSMNGISIFATADVIVFALKRIENSGDMFLLPSSHHPGTSYVAVTAYTSLSDYNCFVAVCSTSNASEVHFNLPQSILDNVGAIEYTAGDTINITLGQFECFQLIANEDLTGLHIQSNVSVIAFSGADKFGTDVGGVITDYIATDLPGMSLAGLLYIVQPRQLDIIKIISTSTSTRVFVDGKCMSEKEVLNAYKFLEYTISCVVTIAASKPIFVAHFPMADSDDQHPALYFVTPVKRYADSMIVYSAKKPMSEEQTCKVFISAVIQNSQTNGFAFDLNIDMVQLNWTYGVDNGVHYAYTNVEVMSDFFTVMSSSEVHFGGYLTCFTPNQNIAVPFVPQIIYSLKIIEENITEENISIVYYESIETTMSITPSSSDSQAPVSDVSSSTTPSATSVAVSTAPVSDLSSSTPSATSVSISAAPVSDVSSSTPSATSVSISAAPVSDVSSSTTPSATSVAISAPGGQSTQTWSYSTQSFLVTNEGPDLFTTSTISEVSTTDSTTQNSTSQIPCNCDICSSDAVYRELNETPSEIQMVVEKLQRTLTVHRNRTSAWLRTKNSAEDDRPSAKGIGGTICVITFSFVFCVIVIPDLMTLASFIKQKLHTLTTVRRPDTMAPV